DEGVATGKTWTRRRAHAPCLAQDRPDCRARSSANRRCSDWCDRQAKNPAVASANTTVSPAALSAGFRQTHFFTRVNGPGLQLFPADAERIVATLVRSRSKAIQRDGKAFDT